MSAVPPPAPETLAALRDVSTATVTMQLLKRGFRSCFIAGARPLGEAKRFAAPAYTLRFVPMREDLSTPDILGDPAYPARGAIEEVPAGHALVIDARGDLRAGVAGGIVAGRLLDRGCAAIVADGPVRDAAEIAGMALPVYCAGGAAPASIAVHFGADAQVAIACGGVTVLPGDVLVGDADGVVVIPRRLAEEVARDGAEQERLETFLTGKVRSGSPIFGTYPPNEQTLAEYREWLDARA